MVDFLRITKDIANFGKSYATYWSNATAGEVGELVEVIEMVIGLTKHSGNLCNLTKKYDRDGTLYEEKIKEELGGIFIYLELTARFFNIDLEQAIIDEITKVNAKRLADQVVVDNND